MRQRVLTTFLLATVSLVSCTPRSPGSSSADASIPASLDGQALPIESVLVANGGSDALHSAVDVLTARCMTQHGLAYIAYPEDKFRSNPFDLNSRYGHLSIETASQFGYHNLQAKDLRKFDELIADIDAKRALISPNYNDILYGSTRADGCFPVAVAQVYGQPGGVSGIDGYQQLVDLQATGSQKASGERAVVDAMNSWSACMADIGYTYPTIYAAKGPFPSSETDLAPPSNEERTQAIADARCRSESRIELILFAAESRIETSLMETNAELVSNFKQAMNDAVIKAQLLVSGHDSPTTTST